jgi:hypothetical protein
MALASAPNDVSRSATSLARGKDLKIRFDGDFSSDTQPFAQVLAANVQKDGT